MLTKQAIYKKAIIKGLYFGQELSCADLSVQIGKSLPLTTKVLNELIEDGMVVTNGYASSTGGRRPHMYSLKADNLYIMSVSMDQEITRFAILDLNNQYACSVKTVELHLSDNSKALSQLTQHIDQYISESGITKEKIVGIGIGMPGFVDVVKGINHSSLKTSAGQSIVSVIESAIGIPVIIDNDSSLIALAELRFGIARQKQNAMVFNIGWGIGLGIILKGELFRGHNGFAGEFSHISLFNNGKICGCGKSGCLETEATLLVIAEKAIQGLKQGKISKLKNLSLNQIESTSEAIMNAAVEGDQFAIELISDAAYDIGRGIAILIHVFNPELVVLSGRGSKVGRLWKTPIQQAINEFCIPKIAADTVVDVSTLGYEAEIIGAAALVMEHYDKLKNVRQKKAVMA